MIKMELTYASVKPGDIVWTIVPRNPANERAKSTNDVSDKIVCEIKIRSATCVVDSRDNLRWKVSGFLMDGLYRYEDNIDQADLFRTQADAALEFASRQRCALCKALRLNMLRGCNKE